MTDQTSSIESDESPETPVEPAGKARGNRWWQWFFLYPAFGMAFLTAVPDWADKAREIYYDLRGVTYAEALEQQAFMQRNWECTQSPHSWVETAVQTSVDGTICPDTGDVFLRIMSSDNTVYLKGITVANFLETENTFNGFSFFQPAYASIIPEVTATKPRRPINFEGFKTAQQIAITICQRWLDDKRKFIKRVQVGGQCFDELFDSFTGKRIESKPAPCSPNC